MSNQDVIKLKALVLHAVTNNQALPGSMERIMFPDLPFMLTQPDIYLLDKDFKEPVYIEEINKPILIASEDFLVQTADKLGQIIFFQFEIKELEKDAVLLTLASKVISSLNKQSLSLSSMQLKFQRVGQEWKLIDQPASLSS